MFHLGFTCEMPRGEVGRVLTRGTIMLTWIVATTAVATLFSSAALAQKPSQGTASIPDFFGIWAHPSGSSGFEPLPSGPAPVTNRSRRNGVGDGYQFVGDYTNPILKPEAA